MFPLFALITVASALAILRVRNLVVAGLCLVLCFLGVAGLFLLLANPVAAALQVIVYSGAIVVLVLFVIMLLDVNEEEAPLGRDILQRWGGILVTAVLAASACRLCSASPLLRSLEGARPPVSMNLLLLGDTLFRDHLLGFEAIGLLLLATMVGAVSLVKKDL